MLVLHCLNSNNVVDLQESNQVVRIGAQLLLPIDLFLQLLLLSPVQLLALHVFFLHLAQLFFVLDLLLLEPLLGLFVLFLSWQVSRVLATRETQ